MVNNARVELHLHLDGSLNIGWLYRKSHQRKTIPSDMTFAEFYRLLYGLNGAHSALSLKKFDIVCNVLQYHEDLEEAAFDLTKRLDELGLYYAEIRLASQQHCQKGLTQLQVLQAVCDGVKRAMTECEIKVNIINCMMHKGDGASVNEKENLETIRITKEMLGKGVVGLDLAGYENNCDFKEYLHLFDIACKEGIPFTVHAAEMGMGEHVMDALSVHPNRIGHGIDCVQKEEWLTAVKESGIPLEVCVTSNIKTTLDYASHPIRRLLEEGLKVTLNSDNMIFAKTNLPAEYAQMRLLGVDEETLHRCTLNAIQASFADEKTKEELYRKVEKDNR